MTLDEHLAALYRQRVLSQNTTAMADFVQALADDAVLKAAAETRYASFTSAITDRDFISKVHRKAIGIALGVETES